jgi:hypothetical protein
MSRTKGKSISVMEVNGNNYSVRVTDHAYSQMYERKVSESLVSKTIASLGSKRLNISKTIGSDSIVINDKDDLAVVFGWEGNRIMVVTVLNSAEEVFAKRGTIIQRV